MSNNQVTSVSITSKHISTSIEASIVTLAKAIQVENSCDINDAINTVRSFMINKHNELLHEDDRKNIDNIVHELETKIKTGSASELDRKVLGIFKLLELI